MGQPSSKDEMTIRALKVKEDDELVRVRLNVLENDVRKIKQRLEIA